MAGKGDKNRTHDLNAYRNSPLWDNLDIHNKKDSKFSEKLDSFSDESKLDNCNYSGSSSDNIKEVIL